MGDELRDWEIRQYYEQQGFQQRFMEISDYREIVPTYRNGYGKRPDAVNFPGDLESMIEDGAVAFHGSVERWRNPLLIDQVSNLDDLREAWDLVIDIDCDHSFELAKKTAELVVEELRQHGIRNISVKFSGNRGFHIGVRGEAFPDKIGDREFPELYPRLARGTVSYLRDQLHGKMVRAVKRFGYEEEMQTDSGLNPYQVSDLENDWGQRHLFRMPYSLNEKSGLVSLPLKPEEIESFEKSDAEPGKVEFEEKFLVEYEEGEASNLAVQAMDFIEEQRDKRTGKSDKEFERPEEAISEQNFPPTIGNILSGLEDGRKRGLFILINFFRAVGYSWEEIEDRIWRWNDRNEEPLREAYIRTQLRWHREREEDVPPPNYDSNGYYRDMGVYEGDSLEEKVSNPVSYAYRMAKDEGGDENELVCPYCGKEYKSEHHYKEHVKQCFG